MMEQRSKKRIFAMLLALVLVASTLSVDVLGSMAAENVEISSYDGAHGAETVKNITVAEADTGSLDGTDKGTGDGLDVSGLDVSGNDMKQTQTEKFLVTKGSGETFGSYDNWEELLADFTVNGDVSKTYVISVLPEAVIGKTMPSKAAEITLQAADEEKSILYFAGNTLNMTTPLVVKAQSLYVADSEKPVAVNTKGKSLTLQDTQHIGTVKGTSKGSLLIKGDVELQGNLQTFQEVKVVGSLQVTATVSAVTNLVLEKGIVYLAAGRKFTVTNVDATAEGVLGFPAEGTAPTVKIAGKVSGVLALRQFAFVQGNFVEREFAAGTKLLTATKATADQFSLAGDKQVCYKKGNVLYVGAEILQLYKGGEHLGTYAQWNDLKTKINNLKDKTAVYRVILLDDYVVNGALSMPTKGRYASLTMENGKGSPITLKATGTLTLTADLTLSDAITLEAKQISAAAWNLNLGEQSVLVTTGNVTVKNMYLAKGVSVQTGGKLTVKGTLETEGDNELVLTYKKSAVVKDTVAAERIVVKLIEKSGVRVTAPQNTIIVNVTGNSYATQYCLLDATGQELALYRKGNTLRVQGALTTPVALYYVGEEKEICLGQYATLADVKTEITRRKIKQGAYRVDVGDDVVVKGALPLPKAGTYESITFTGKQIRFTGNLTLTGNTTFYNEIQKVKSELVVTPLPITANLSKYTLIIPQGGAIENLSSVSGSTGSVLWIQEGVKQTVAGNLKAESLKLDGILDVAGNITVTDIYPGAGNRLDYELTKTVTIKGAVCGSTDKLVLNPLRSGTQSVYTDGMKVLGSASKVAVGSLTMAQETDWVLYKDGSVVRLGKPLLTVFENTVDYESVLNADNTGKLRFARINDAMEYINTQEAVDFVIRLDENIPSAGALTTPDKGKNLVLCTAAGERKTLNMTGSIVLDGSSLQVRNIDLDNGTASGPGIILKNSAAVHLCDVDVNTITAPAKTSLTLEGTVGIRGAVAGACDMTILQDAVVRASNSVMVNNLTLNAADEGTAQLRLLVGKKMTVNNTITTPENGRFIINRVDRTDALASLSTGTVMVIAPYGQSSQFKTQNIMPGTFQEWSLIKKGDSIQTSEVSQGDGEWSGDFL